MTDEEYTDESEYEEDDDEVVDTSPYSSRQLPSFTQDELAAARQFKDWLLMVGDHKHRSFFSDNMEDLDDVDASDIIKCNTIVKIIGDRDEAGDLDGEVEEFYENGDYFWGHYHHGVRQGEASMVLRNGDHYLGSYDAGVLTGLVREEVEGGCLVRECVYRRGRRHGVFRELRGRDLRLESWGHYTHGVKTGHCWTRTK